VISLEEAYQKKMREAGTEENALQNLQQRMMNMANSQPDSPHFASNPPRPATSMMGDNIFDVARVPCVVPGNNTRGQTQDNSTRSNPSPRKFGK
jgi:hypothetical protein